MEDFRLEKANCAPFINRQSVKAVEQELHWLHHHPLRKDKRKENIPPFLNEKLDSKEEQYLILKVIIIVS